jgi:hypothetical protein
MVMSDMDLLHDQFELWWVGSGGLTRYSWFGYRGEA